MAKAKKKESLTPEERLQAALVPESEQPYPVPENWCWTYFKPISKIRTGKKDANYGSVDGEYPFFTCAVQPIRCHGYSFDCNAILLAGNGDINNISRYRGKFEAYQRTYVVEIIEPINIDYVFYWFKYRWFDFNKDKMFGTAIPYIRLGNLQEFRLLSHLLHNSNALLTVLKACLSSWMRPSKRHRMYCTALEPVRPPSFIKPSPLNSLPSGEKSMAWRWRVRKMYLSPKFVTH